MRALISANRKYAIVVLLGSSLMGFMVYSNLLSDTNSNLRTRNRNRKDDTSAQVFSTDSGTARNDTSTDVGIPSSNPRIATTNLRPIAADQHCPVRANLTRESPSQKYNSNTIPRDLYRLAPNVFNNVPPEFFNGYRSPCWNKDGQLVCLPKFFLAGVGKAGTSDLWMRITSHPQIIQSPKEPRWWARARLGRKSYFGNLKSFSKYLQLFSRLSKIIALNTTDASTVISGDGSPSTYWDNMNWRAYVPSTCQEGPTYVLADVIHTVLPQSKIIAIFRNPVDRLYSDYIYGGGKWRSPETFHNHVTKSTSKLQSCLSTGRNIRSCVYSFFEWEYYEGREHVVMLIKGLYSIFARDWLNVFPRDQLMFIRFEDWVEKCGEVLPDIYTFLELETMSGFNISEICSKKKVNPTPRKKSAGPMLEKTRTILENFYRVWNEDLAHTLSDDRWKHWS